MREAKHKGVSDCDSVWTPLFYPAEDWPLALCDGSTVTNEDFITIRKIRHDSEGDGFCPLYRRHYKWYYLEAQSPDEALLLKNYDSSSSVKAKCISPCVARM